jgi:holliday junction DNA helicase RuvA
MIGRLTGIVEPSDGDGVLVDVHGVAYDVICPIGTVGRAAKAQDGRQTLLIHTHVREDQFTLYGFADEADRQAFRSLISVSNVGPKIALAILSSMSAAELGQTLARKELGKLTAISGVGKKTAERLLLELKDKIVISTGAGTIAARAVPSASGATADVLTGALVKMGYKLAEVERVLPSVHEATGETADLTAKLRKALELLAK